MTSKENNGDKLRCKKRKVIQDIVEDLGFKNEAELARASGIDQGNLNRILTGEVSLTDLRASQICWAIFDKNCHQGFTYSDCAMHLADIINYSRSHIANLEGKNPRARITDNDVNRWINDYKEKRKKRRSIEQRSLNSNSKDHVKSREYTEVMEYTKLWKFKHDFDLPNIVQQRFKTNLPIFSNFLYQGMNENNYQEVKEVFKNIRHIAHLCGAKDLVLDVSLWLGEQSTNCGDMSTCILAESSLAWSYASRTKEKELTLARDIMEEAWESLEDIKFFMQTDADVIAILSELKLRIPIRLYLLKKQHLSEGKFGELWHQSSHMLDKLLQDRALEPRLKERFKIALQYQHGIYCYLTQQYEKAIEKFTYIAKRTNLIGWTRVEQGAYSWLVTLTEKIGNRDACLEYLEKIDEERANQKRLDIRDSMYARLGKN